MKERKDRRPLSKLILTTITLVLTAFQMICALIFTVNGSMHKYLHSSFETLVGQEL